MPKCKTIFSGTIVIAILCCLAQPASRVADAADAGKLTLSKGTTFFTKPLTSDGGVDYAEALNAHFGQDVAPDENSVVGFWLALGPGELSPEIRAKFFELLGIEPLAETDDDYFVSLKDFARGQQVDDQAVDQLYEWLGNDASRRPWSAEDYPVLAAWLAANQRPLARFVEATNRPRAFWPIVADPDRPALSSALARRTPELREVARALYGRAMHRLHAKGVEAAWEDISALHRLARHLCSNPSSEHALTGAAIEGMAFRSQTALASWADVSREQFQRMRDDLEEIGPIARVSEAGIVGERCTFLDWAQRVRSGQADEGYILTYDEFVEEFSRHEPPVAWDEVLRSWNELCDRLATLSRLPPSERANQLAEQRRHVTEPVADLAAENDPFSRMAAVAKLARTATPTRRGELLFAVMADMHVAVWEHQLTIYDRMADQWLLGRLAIALAEYKLDHGSYPEGLAKLQPKYIDNIGASVFNGRPFHFRRCGNGFLLWSVMTDGDESLADYRYQFIWAYDQCACDNAASALRKTGWQVKPYDIINSEFSDVSRGEGQLTPEAMSQVVSLPLLGSLELTGKDVTNDTLSHLANAPTLETADFSGTSVTDDGLKHLAAHTGLESLRLDDTEVSDAGLAHLVTLKRLYSLSLANTQVSCQGLAHLKGLEKLSSLNLSGTAIDGEGFSHLQPLKELSTIRLDGTKVTDERLAKLADLPALSDLSIAETRITNKGLKSLASMPTLRILDLSGNEITVEGLRHLAGHPTLSRLTLAQTGISDDALPALTHLSQLTDLSLEGTKITDEGLKTIAQVKGLRLLDLSRTQISGSGLKYLHTMPHLQILSMLEMRIPESSIETLRQAMPMCEIFYYHE